MTTGCWNDQFDDDDENGGAHRRGQKENIMDSHIAGILARMSDADYKELIEAVEAERGPKRPRSVHDAAADYRAGSGEGMRIPSGVSPARLAELLKSANPDTFTVGGDGSSHIDL